MLIYSLITRPIFKNSGKWTALLSNSPQYGLDLRNYLSLILVLGPLSILIKNKELGIKKATN